MQTLPAFMTRSLLCGRRVRSSAYHYILNMMSVNRQRLRKACQSVQGGRLRADHAVGPSTRRNLMAPHKVIWRAIFNLPRNIRKATAVLSIKTFLMFCSKVGGRSIV